MTELTDAEKEAEKLGWWRGVIFAVSHIYSGHGCSVSAKEALESLGAELHDACRNSCEFDVRPLRRVINDLPLGEDADYCHLRVAPVDGDGEDCPEEEAFEFEVRGDYAGQTEVISSFDEIEAANSFMESNAVFLLAEAKH
jgi:hypothetical protein